tara:strand:- start:373 stop:2172 length:1800 start_codon:yes stop_codon:yes gene_type:complete
MVNKRQELVGTAVSLNIILESKIVWLAPRFQRKYVWSDLQIDTLFDDIDSAIEDKDAKVFLGAIVSSVFEQGKITESQTNWLVDGQQRITTFYLLLVAVIEICQNNNFDNEAKTIAKKFIILDEEDSKRANEPKLRPTFTDKEEFNNIIRKIKIVRPNNVGSPNDEFNTSNLTKNYERIKNYLINKKFEGKSIFESLDVLTDFLERLLGNIQFVEIQLGEDHDVYEVFDRLNTGGQKLDVIDLIRNVVFSKVNDDNAQIIYDDDWLPFESSFEKKDDFEKDDPKSMSDHYKNIGEFFYPYTQISNPSVTKASVYNTLRLQWDENFGNYDSEKQAQQIIKSMKEYVLPFNIITVGKSKNADFPEEIKKEISSLFRMGIPKTTHSFLMQSIKSYHDNKIKEHELINVFKFLKSFLVRRSFLGQEPTGIKALFQDMFQKCGTDLKKLLDKVSTATQKFPTDNDFKNSIDSPIYNRRLCKFILLEYEIDNNHNFESMNLNLSHIEIDHVLPQNHSKKWQNFFSTDDHEKYVDSWANLVLLTKKDNSIKSDRPFEDAKEIYKKDPFITTKEISDYDVWNIESLRKRSSKLISYAMDKWKYPDNM